MYKSRSPVAGKAELEIFICTLAVVGYVFSSCLTQNATDILLVNLL